MYKFPPCKATILTIISSVDAEWSHLVYQFFSEILPLNKKIHFWRFLVQKFNLRKCNIKKHLMLDINRPSLWHRAAPWQSGTYCFMRTGADKNIIILHRRNLRNVQFLSETHIGQQWVQVDREDALFNTGARFALYWPTAAENELSDCVSVGDHVRQKHILWYLFVVLTYCVSNFAQMSFYT